MKDFFDKLYFGGYYVGILISQSVEFLLISPLNKFFLFLGKFSSIRQIYERQGKTYEQVMKENSIVHKRTMKAFDEAGFTHFQTGRLFFPMACGFWIDLAIIPFLIFERNILPYPFKGGNLIIFAAVFGILSFLMIFRDERCQRVVKEYRKKPQKEQRKAFCLFIGMYILVIIPIFLLFQYERKKNGW